MLIFTGRGARMREGQPWGKGSRRCAPVSPLPKVFPLAHVSQAKLRSLPKANVRSLFPYLLPSVALTGSGADIGGWGSGKRGRTFAKGKLRSFACETCAGGENLRG